MIKRDSPSFRQGRSRAIGKASGGGGFVHRLEDLPLRKARLPSPLMFEDFHIEHDWVIVLAAIFGAAVIVPSLLSLFVSLGAVAAMLF